MKFYHWLFLLLLIAGNGIQAQEHEIQYLSGTGYQHTVPWDFFCTAGRNSGQWTSIRVPSCWELEGFGNYNYGRDYKTYGKNFRFFDEKGMYRYRFSVPAKWKQKKVFIVFEGSMTDTEVKINGKLAGPTHRGAFYEFRYEISDKLYSDRPNLLEVAVAKMSADASVNNAERLADYWIFGGIFRPVYLEAVPQQYIQHTSIDARADGNFSLQVATGKLQQPATVDASILDATGKQVARLSANISSNDSLVIMHGQVNGPLTWTAETPHLYKVLLRLKSAAGILHQTTETFGFRTLEVRRGEGIFLNGVQIKMKGINRHCFWPESGRTLNDSIQLMDLQLLRGMNMNAVRCSHYPPDKKFLQLCDSIGLYVLDELAGWQKAYSTAAGKPLVKEMVLRDANHPSILFWDNGNEGGTNKELDAEFDKWDFSRRPVIHPHHRPGNAFNGIDCNHYEDYYSTRNILADSLIYMPTEFLHSQDDGGGAAALADFWELHWHAKRSGGGFIWALLDEGVVRTDLNNIIDVNGVNAPDGILGPHREKEGSYQAIREIYCPVKIAGQSLPANFTGALPVENRFHFTNLRQCSFEWQLVNFKQPADWQTGFGVGSTGHAEAPDIAPGDSGWLKLNLPEGFKSYDALTLSAFDTYHNLLNKWSWRLKDNESLLKAVVSTTDTATVTTVVSDTAITMRSGGISISFSKKDGSINNIKSSHGDKLSFSGGPVMATGASRFVDMQSIPGADGDVVECRYSGNLSYARWKMWKGGWISLEYMYALQDKVPFAGISFNYPENYVLGAKWLGKGPSRVWKNRLQGVNDNVWQNAYNNTQTGSAPWIFPEFKGYYADIAWMEINTVEGKFMIASKQPGLYMRLFDFYGLSGVKPAPDLPPGNISLLDAIPPIGTKLALNISYNTSVLGPHSEPNLLSAPVKRTVYFYFGLPPQTKQPSNFQVPLKDELF